MYTKLQHVSPHLPRDPPWEQLVTGTATNQGLLLKINRSLQDVTHDTERHATHKRPVQRVEGVPPELPCLALESVGQLVQLGFTRWSGAILCRNSHHRLDIYPSVLAKLSPGHTIGRAIVYMILGPLLTIRANTSGSSSSSQPLMRKTLGAVRLYVVLNTT